jgi:type IX secretion system PorP/SprF family membrane protein
MTNLKTIRINLLFLFFLGISANAQQESQFTQYMYNTVSINPAYAGSRDVLSILGLYRTQWIGLEGAPKTANFTLNSPITDRMGLGFSVVNDQIGPSDENNIAMDFSYNIPLNENYRLFFGLKGSANILNIDYTKLDIYDSNDPKYQNNVDHKFSPNIGLGMYLQSEKGYFGVSIPYMLETKHYDHFSTSETSEKMHLYVIGGYVFDLSYNLKFKPAVLTKIVTGVPLQVDLSANFLFNEKFIIGAAYRFDAAFSGMAGFQISPGLLAGYAYDFDTTNLGNYNSGSHELFLRFEIFKDEAIINPRFF